MSIYLDTCIVIYVVERHPLYSASIETLMRNAGAVDFCYYASRAVRMSGDAV